VSAKIVIASVVLTLLVGGGALVVLSPGLSEGIGGGDPGPAGSWADSDRGTSPGIGPSEGSAGGSGRESAASRAERAAESFLREGRDSRGRVRPRNGGGSGSSGSFGGDAGWIDGDDPADRLGDGRTGSNASRRGGPSASGRRGSGGGGSRGSGANGQLTGAGGIGEPEPFANEITLSGTLITIDDQGTRHESESGSLEVRFTGSGVDTTRTVSVTNGEWSTVAPAGGNLQFVDATIADRPAAITPVNLLGVREGQVVSLTARWASQTLLHVRSNVTGEDLCGLRLLRIPEWMRNSRPHPGTPLPTDQLWTAECSPLTVTSDGVPVGQSIAYHVHAPGHAWGRILIDMSNGGDREILLDPGGALNITFDGVWNQPNALLRLRVLGELQPYAECPLTGQSMLIDGIEPGNYEVSVETGSWAQDPLVLGSMEVFVSAGEAQPLLLPIVEIQEQERVPFGGTVFVPSGWLLDDFTLRLRPTDPGANVTEGTQHIAAGDMTTTDMGDGVLYSWQAADVEPGNFGALILPIGYGVSFQVPETGNLDANISLPAPVLVQVQTLIAGSNLPATPDVLRWTPVREAGVPGAGAVAISADPPGTNNFLFDAPLGGVIISCNDPAYRPASRQLTLTEGAPAVFTFELEPAQGLEIQLYDEDTLVPWDTGWHATMTPLPGTEGGVVTRGRVGVAYRILVSAAGWYTLNLPTIDGFLPPDPIEVQIFDGETTPLDVPLQRIP
jgi:hypothetical protein